MQTDIKRVIAYSTMSQIGYMFLGAGSARTRSAMFHLMTHAFFKALLFLAAGIVIHALAGEQDIRKMGGLRDALPRTYLAFLIGALALVGIPPLSGFFSKDSILASALARRGGRYGYVLFVVGLGGAFLTGSTRSGCSSSSSAASRSPYAREHLHARARRGAVLDGATVGVLAVLSVVGGWIQFAGLWHPLSDWLDPVAEPLVEPIGDAGLGHERRLDGARARPGSRSPGRSTTKRAARCRVPPRRARVLEHKFYFDELYDAVFYRRPSALARALGRGVEGR